MISESAITRLRRRAHVHGDTCYGRGEYCGEHHAHDTHCFSRPIVCGLREDLDLIALLAAYLEAAVQRDEALATLNTPELHDFAKAVRLEGAHQRAKWGTDGDDGKSPADWFWLVGYLAGKALASHVRGEVDKALHHTITAAAALANWHSAVLGKTNMRPGIARPAGEELLVEARGRAET